MRYWVAVVVAMLAVVPVAAQDEAWDVEQRCIGEPTEPPEDWSFDGTLVMTSTANSMRRVHTYQYNWETPRVRLYVDTDVPSSGQLSFDDRWFVEIAGNRIDGESYSIVTWTTEALNVYDLVSEDVYTIDWVGTFSAVNSLRSNRLIWLDNQMIVYSKKFGCGGADFYYIIDPFSGEIRDWEREYRPSTAALRIAISPNAKNAIYPVSSDDYVLLNQGEVSQIILSGDVYWSPTSDSFIAYTDSTRSDLGLFDKTGELTEILLDTSQFSENTRVQVIDWSPNGDYVLIRQPDYSHVMASVQERSVIDLCITSTYLTGSWSPDSQQLAFVDARRGDGRAIQIFDTNVWEQYIAAYHRGNLIGWTAAEAE